jgi:hypothetical protein
MRPELPPKCRAFTGAPAAANAAVPRSRTDIGKPQRLPEHCARNV